MSVGGKVYLTGAGLGTVEDLTVRAQQALKHAEVLIYDALVDSELLSLVPPSCLKVDVGKRGGGVSTPQGEINRLLVYYGQQGKRVVRLKSGDPFIFGRTSSEIQALIEADCAFEVIPGLSSALAGPLWAGIPLTDPVVSRGFMVFTAHEIEGLNWGAIAQLETLVILMGGRNLKDIIQRLIRHGRALATPIAIIRWAGRPDAQIWTGELDTIIAKTAGEELSPCVIVVGEVVRLREYLHAFRMTDTMGQQPLKGKTILVTRAAGQASDLTELLEQQGATPIEMPTLEIVPPSSWEGLDEAIAQLASFDWLILTSANAVESFFQRLTAHNLDTRVLATVKIAVVGKKTAACLAQYHLIPDLIPPDFVADSLIEQFPENLQGQKILFPRVETGGREVLVQQLSAKGAHVVEVAAYESRCPNSISESALTALKNQQVDVITFASSKTVKNFCNLWEKAGKIDLNRVAIASIGPQTSQTCQQLLGRVDIEATEYTLEGLVSAILHFYQGVYNT